MSLQPQVQFRRRFRIHLLLIIRDQDIGANVKACSNTCDWFLASFCCCNRCAVSRSPRCASNILSAQSERTTSASTPSLGRLGRKIPRSSWIEFSNNSCAGDAPITSLGSASWYAALTTVIHQTTAIKYGYQITCYADTFLIFCLHFLQLHFPVLRPPKLIHVLCL